MRRVPELTRPDLIRARAVLAAMRNGAGKQIRTVEQAVAWVDQHRPELTEAWLAWVGERFDLRSEAEPNGEWPGNPPPLLS